MTTKQSSNFYNLNQETLLILLDNLMKSIRSAIEVGPHSSISVISNFSEENSQGTKQFRETGWKELELKLTWR